ncbi:MAG: CBS domain-containing protein [Deltaproteobacteria bacterium]|nr:CBS domain-containing protein [Deltaproteobacteria bacterium]
MSQNSTAEANKKKDNSVKEEKTSLTKEDIDSMTARQVMEKRYPTIDASKQISDAYELMTELGLEYLPVVQDQRVVRVLTKNSIETIRSAHFDAPGQDQRVARLMCLPLSIVNNNQELITAKADDPVRKVMRVMSENKINSVPVVKDNGEIEGMITTHKILKLICDV